MKTLAWLTKQFSGFPGAIFGLGIVLLFFGLINTIPGSDAQINENFRMIAVIGGFIFIVVAIVMHFFVRDNEAPLDDSELTETQLLILQLIRDEYMLHGLVSQTDIECRTNEKRRKIKKSEISIEEMYYRLEYLIFKGYITKVPASYEDGRYRFTYFLSDKYRSREGIAKVKARTVVSEMPP
jgi:predicted transcriptional regulator